jgi:inhibitor of cysteine peptidase
MNGRLSIVFAAATMTAILAGVITASNSFAQQGTIADGIERQDRNQARLMDRTTYPNIIPSSGGLQQSITPSPLNQSTSPISTNATLSVKTNEQFYITLSSNPSTGYEWQVASVSNPDMVRFVDSQYIRPESELVGAPGKQVLTFNALQEGSATIQLEYVRPWETGVPPVSIYVAEVMVVENGIQQ